MVTLVNVVTIIGFRTGFGVFSVAHSKKMFKRTIINYIIILFRIQSQFWWTILCQKVGQRGRWTAWRFGRIWRCSSWRRSRFESSFPIGTSVFSILFFSNKSVDLMMDKTYRSVVIVCSKCSTILTSPTIHLCPCTRTNHPHGRTRSTTRSSTIAWSHLARPNLTQVSGKYPWSCGKILTAVGAPWEMVVVILPTQRESTRCWSRILNGIILQTGLLSIFIHSNLFKAYIFCSNSGRHSPCTITRPGLRHLITRRVSKLSLIQSFLWTTFGWWPTGKPSSGFVILRPLIALKVSNPSSATIRLVNFLFFYLFKS